MSSKILTATYAIGSAFALAVVSAFVGFIILPELGRVIAYVHTTVASARGSTEHELIKLNTMFGVFLLWVGPVAHQVWLRGRNHYNQSIMRILFACCAILVSAWLLSPTLPLEIVLGIMIVSASMLKYYSIE